MRTLQSDALGSNKHLGNLNLKARHALRSNDLVLRSSFLSLLFCGLAACATTESSQDADDKDLEGVGRIEQGRNEVRVSVEYKSTAKANWIRAEEEFVDESYLAAQKYYTYIRSKFPYSAFASRAELRVADCMFERRRYVEAVDTYQNFVRLYSTHPKVPYAYFMTAKAYHKQIPEDWFILPPSHEKDQGSVRRAAQALSAYVDRFPKDENIKIGKELLGAVRTRLMNHERYVADFYRKQGQNRAYVGRLEVIRSRFTDVGMTDELLFEIVEVYAALGESEKAAKAEAELGRRFAKSPLLSKAKAVVAKITTKKVSK